MIMHNRHSILMPPIGWWVHWYEDAGRNRQPLAALVTQSGGPNQLDLLLWFPSGGEPRRLRNIRHIDDPRLKESIEMRARDGAWDWIPGHRYQPPPQQEPSTEHQERHTGRQPLPVNMVREQQAQPQPEPAETAVPQPWIDMITRLWDHGVSEEKIYHRMRGRKVTRSQVHDIVSTLPEPTQVVDD